MQAHPEFEIPKLIILINCHDFKVHTMRRSFYYIIYSRLFASRRCSFVCTYVLSMILSRILNVKKLRNHQQQNVALLLKHNVFASEQVGFQNIISSRLFTSRRYSLAPLRGWLPAAQCQSVRLHFHHEMLVIL